MCKTPRALVFVALAITIGLVLPAHAQEATSTTSSVIADWTNPGSFPFSGDYSDVCALYSHEITGEQCARAIDEEERGLGDELFLQEGFILEVSFTVGDAHQSKILRVSFGDDVPADDPLRRALVFDTGRSDGLKLVRPDVCGNWSLMTIREAPPAETPVVANHPTEVLLCQMESRRRQSGGDSLYLSSLQTCGGGCGQSFHIPGLLLEGNVIKSNGQGLVCDWYPIQ